MGTYDHLRHDNQPSAPRAAGTPAVVAGALLFTLVSGLIPRAAADPAPKVYVRTESGIVRCVIRSEEVTCEAGETREQPYTGFLQAPTDPNKIHWDLAVVNATGDFHWGEGNIGTPLSAGETVLNYGTEYHFSGWTVKGTSEGTRFSNDSTGHGMFVSVQNVHSF